ncbi:hypothetical protein [Glutamicibacter mishrai]|uniref:DUF4262 domain-containing protein n=1 Tax=Glutamicibacter mishrai TaxID=1775880 RepID=A0A6H0SG53_9MICC|nr:hypothetical protein [Glutamicibacter mishrai]QIV86632.1 hypothetical protein D3791_05505 [Glutamicibacter mishrai]
MEDLRYGRYSVRSTLSAQTKETILMVEELKLRGYCVLTYRAPRSSRIAVATLGLGYVNHPEIFIATEPEKEEEASGVLHYLAEQVLEHGKELTEGSYGKSIYRELVFREEHFDLDPFEDSDPFEDMDPFEDFDDDYEGAFPGWLVCSLPTKILAPSHAEDERCQFKAA